MKNLTPYLFFNGNCREAMEFYQQCFNGKLEVMAYGDHDGHDCGEDMKDKVMHACLASEGFMLMASDSPGKKTEVGTNIQIAADCESLEEMNRVFAAMSKGGKVEAPLHDAFWGDRFGAVVDKYSVKWMFTYSPKQK